jgi:hypothetical protein
VWRSLEEIGQRLGFWEGLEAGSLVLPDLFSTQLPAFALLLAKQVAGDIVRRLCVAAGRCGPSDEILSEVYTSPRP